MSDTSPGAPAGAGSAPEADLLLGEFSREVVGYRSGTDRNAAAYGIARASHTYAMMADGELWPMCGYGWNRSDGEAFSILRDAPGTEGNCKRCRSNVAAGKPPLFDGFPHKTKWI